MPEEDPWGPLGVLVGWGTLDLPDARSFRALDAEEVRFVPCFDCTLPDPFPV